jgi:hypothetical protein
MSRPGPMSKSGFDPRQQGTTLRVSSGKSKVSDSQVASGMPRFALGSAMVRITGGAYVPNADLPPIEPAP